MTLDEKYSDLVSGKLYSVYKYTDQIYKIVKFKTPRISTGQVKKLERKINVSEVKSGKWDSALSRARRIILEIALCNPWQYFCTFTISPEKYDRFNLDVYYKDFSQWIRNQRKKYGYEIKYLLIPEMHENGAWHVHGLMNMLPDPVLLDDFIGQETFGPFRPVDMPFLCSFSDLFRYGFNVPKKLIRDDFYCLTHCWEKFGYCSLGLIKDSVAASFYISKYVGKGLDSNSDMGMHLYRASLGLNRSVKQVDVSKQQDALDRFLVNHYQFCDTGMTHVNHCLDWSFAMEYQPNAVKPLFLDDYGSEPEYSVFESYESSLQEVLDGF